MTGVAMHDRAERYLPVSSGSVSLSLPEVRGTVANISRTGLACTFDSTAGEGQPPFVTGTTVSRVRVSFDGEAIDLGPGRVARVTTAEAPGPAVDGESQTLVGIAFDHDQWESLQSLASYLKPYGYVTGELADLSDTWPLGQGTVANDAATEQTLDRFYRKDDPDILAKCRHFRAWTGAMQNQCLSQRLWRVTATTAIDSQTTIFDPIQRRERVMRCFDTNGYLGLHRHPRVLSAVQRALAQVGYGTPSSQMLGGTNRHLRELEDKLSEMHGREDTIVFPTGYAANTGTISALVRRKDAILSDAHAHASVQNGCKASSARFFRRFRHNDADHLDRMLDKADRAGAVGKLVITDGVFSMHGKVAPLPELLATCRKHGARLMIDDAHGFGVLGENGHGIEEHFGLKGQVDIMMGTLSKAVGSVGGYISGSKDMVTYLRYFADSGMFTTALPAALCAGMLEALAIIEEEPEHRASLWRNVAYFSNAVRQAGFIAPEPESPIIPVHIGPQKLLWQISKDLFDAGVKCGGVIYPAVAKNEAILRFVVNACHTRSDLDFAVDALSRAGRAAGILGKSRDEIQALWGTDGTAPASHHELRSAA
ncbi:MAG: aminotransferase class I/II-fold pyridoxal phosphate-dependent enzyme [Myxococcales bacterium]|nr:aminotransferase class I/II-fold pyridoxal phosphate-dependent enzyme [Myxococcales bacterium]